MVRLRLGSNQCQEVWTVAAEVRGQAERVRLLISIARPGHDKCA